MTRLVECVPNFSEGRKTETIARLVEIIESVESAIVLDTHIDADHNRSVITFVADADAVVEAAVRAASLAAQLIDLRTHTGQHPRVGALDVLPFVPVRGVTLKDCIGLAHEAGERIAHEVGVPVYFYEAAARTPDRLNLEDVRRKGFEQLRDEIARLPERAPDVGEARMHARAGACIVGARPLLIAYNVNLQTDDVAVARRIAGAVRGRDGGLRFLKALGFELPERGLTQVSMNLVRFEKTSLHHAFEAVCREAKRWGVRVASSEIVGLIPQAALDRSAEYFLQIENFSPDLVLENRIAAALAGKEERQGDAGTRGRGERNMGTASMWHEGVEGDIGASSPISFAASPHRRLTTSSKISGGGVAAAQAAAVAASLGEMVAHLIERRAQRQDSGRAALDALQELKALSERLIEAAEEDAASFARVLAARRMAHTTLEEERGRANALEAALKGAASVPLEVAGVAVQVAELIEMLAELSEPAWLSDSACGAQLALSAVVAARYNVLVNTQELDDEEFAAEQRSRADDLWERAREIAARVEALLLDSIA